MTRVTDSQFKKVKNCCNYNNGFCCVLDGGCAY